MWNVASGEQGSGSPGQGISLQPGRLEVDSIQEIRMSEAVRITTPVPSVEETARIVGVPLPRAKELVELADRVSREVSSRASRRPAATRRATRRARSRMGRR